MWKRSLLVLALVAGGLGTVNLCAQSVPAPELPGGSMQVKATTACTECHDSRIIVQQQLSKAAWTKVVDKMIRWGAVVDPQDHDALIDYLSTNFGIDRPAYVSDRLASPKPTKK